VYSFCAQSGCPDGENPGSPLVQSTDGNPYATTVYGGTGSGFLEIFTEEQQKYHNIADHERRMLIDSVDRLARISIASDSPAGSHCVSYVSESDSNQARILRLPPATVRKFPHKIAYPMAAQPLGDIEQLLRRRRRRRIRARAAFYVSSDAVL